MLSEIVFRYVLPFLCIAMGMYGLTQGKLGLALRPRAHPTTRQKIIRIIGVMFAGLVTATGLYNVATIGQELGSAHILLSGAVAFMLLVLLFLADAEKGADC